MKFTKSFIAVLAVAALTLQFLAAPMLSLGKVSAAAAASIESLESCDSFTGVKSGTYGKLVLGDYYSPKYSLNTDASYVLDGAKSLKVTPVQSMFKFFVDLRDSTGAVTPYENITFYVNLPAGMVEDAASQSDTAKYPDGKYGLGVGLTGGTGVWDAMPTLSNITVTYYFKDGSKFTKTENGIYAYQKDGTVSTTGFEGYVSVKLNESDYNSTTKYLMLYTLSAAYKDNLFKKDVFFDDFRCIDPSSFTYKEEAAATPDPAPTGTPSKAGAIESLESCDSFTGVKSGTYSKLVLGDFYSPKYSLNTDASYVSDGKKSLKVTPVQSMFKFFVDLRDSTGAVPQYENVTFYVNLPAGVAEDAASQSDTAKYPDGKYGLGVGLTGGTGVWDAMPTLSNITVTYYFKDGSKLTKTENGIYAYRKDGTVSTTGFEGYVSVKLNESDYNSATKYLMLYTLSAAYKENLFKSDVFFDDFRCIDPSSFTYKKTGAGSSTATGGSGSANADSDSIEDFEKVADSWDPYSAFTGSRVSATKYYESEFALDTEFWAQGAKSLKASVGSQGNFEFYVLLKKPEEAVPAYTDLAFYIHLPEGTYVTESGTKYGVKVVLNDAANTKTTTPLKGKFTYYFKDGSTLVKEGEDGIYPYDKTGKLSSKGFNGYVAVSLEGQDLSANSYAVISATSTTWGKAFAKQDIHFDDFRGVKAGEFVPYDGSNYVEEVDPEIANGYTLVDFEEIDSATYDPTKWNDQNSNFLAQKYYGTNFSIDTTGRLQGKNALKIGTSGQGAFETQVIVPSEARDASRFDGVAFYCTIPAGDYLDSAQRVGFTLTIKDNAETRTLSNATVTYIFDNGAKVTKTGQDGIYSYGKSGTLDENGFKGYVVVSFDSFAELDKTTVKSVVLKTTATYKESFKNTTFYLDDFRFVYAKTFDPFGLYASSPGSGESARGTLGLLAAAVTMTAVLVIVKRKKIFG